MTRLLRYTLEQWDELRSAAWMVAAAVMDSDHSGPLGTSHERDAVRDALKAATKPGARRQLTYRIAEELLSDYDGKPPASLGSPRWAVALDHLRRAMATLDATTAAAEATDFRQWLWEIAEGVAGAAREGFAGLGARVSEEEQEMLEHIRAELGVVG